MEARGEDGGDGAGSSVQRVREKLAWMQDIVQEGLARIEPGGNGNSADASQGDGNSADASQDDDADTIT
jgi:hypothetical protein